MSAESPPTAEGSQIPVYLRACAHSGAAAPARSLTGELSPTRSSAGGCCEGSKCSSWCAISFYSCSNRTLCRLAPAPQRNQLLSLVLLNSLMCAELFRSPQLTAPCVSLAVSLSRPETA